jgi:hypothetical protein
MKDSEKKVNHLPPKIHPQVHTNSPEELAETDELPKSGNKVVTIVFISLVVVGVVTGFVLSRKIDTTKKTTTTTEETPLGKNSVGSTDTKLFKDSAVGTIEEGGLDGEGSHKLIREGGPSQTVYMISSVIDLQEFIGKKVTVWGQTMAAKKVPWLMDVGRVDLQQE